MPNGRSRNKGARGERDLVHKLGGSAQRKGYSYVETPIDVETDFAVYQVKNRTIGGSLIADEIMKLEVDRPVKNHYVVFKVRGKWYLAETLAQHKGDHSDRDLNLKEEASY